jgi:hypothetical protein
MDVLAGFENYNGRVGVVGEYHIIARFLQFNLEDVLDQEFIFNDKNSSQLPPSSSQGGKWIKVQIVGRVP